MHKLFSNWFYNFDKYDEIPGFVVCSYIFCAIIFIFGILSLKGAEDASLSHVVLNSVNFFILLLIGLMSLVYNMKKTPLKVKEAVFGASYIIASVAAAVQFVWFLITISPLLALGFVGLILTFITFIFFYVKTGKEG